MFAARIAFALVCFQISGYGRLVTDLLASAGVIEEHADDCSDEDDERGCPPGCPTCHCMHCVTPALPAPAPSEALPPPEPTSVVAFEERAATPAAPDLAHVYRPPRSASPHS